MIVALVASLLLGDVRDFYPLAQGTKWTYETTMSGPRVVSTSEAGAPTDVDGEAAVPIKTKVGGQTVETMFYRAKDDTLSLVAYAATKPLSDPRTILVLPTDGSAKWNYETDEEGIPLKVNCEATLKGKRTVFDQEVDVLELKLDAVLGDSRSVAMEFKQVAIYARGIGMVEMNEDRKVNKKSHKRRIKLIKFEPGAVGNQ